VVVVVGCGAGAGDVAVVVVVVGGGAPEGPGEVVGGLVGAVGVGRPPDDTVVAGQSDDRMVVVTVTVPARASGGAPTSAGPEFPAAGGAGTSRRDGAIPETVMPPSAAA
jgi:hypothetical protein